MTQSHRTHPPLPLPVSTCWLSRPPSSAACGAEEPLSVISSSMMVDAILRDHWSAKWSGVEWSGVVPASGKVHAQLSTARHIDVVQQRSLALHGQSDRSIDSFIHSFIHSFMYPSMLSYDQDESASPIPTNKAQDRNRQLARDMLFQLLTRSWLSMIISITVTTWSRAPSSRLDVVVDSVSNFSWHPRQCSLSSTRTNTKREQDQECDDGEPLELQSVLASLHIHSFIHSFIVSFWFLVS